MVNAETTLGRLEEVLRGCLYGENVESGWVMFHTCDRWASRLGCHFNATSEQFFAALVGFVDVLAEVVIVLARHRFLVVSKAAVVRETVLISLSGREAASRGAVNSYGVFFGEESCCDTGVGLGHRVAVYHSSDVAGITWDLLAAHVMGWACNPVFGEFALVSKDILIHLGTSWQIYVALHALLKSDAAHVVFVASGLANFLVDGACSFAKQVIFEGHVSCVARQILASPRALLLGAML